MVDIMDMEDIFYDIILDWAIRGYKTNGRIIAKNIIEEVKDFVDAQKNIACNNCKGKKFKKMREACEVF